MCFARPTSWVSGLWRFTPMKIGSRSIGSKPMRPTRWARPASRFAAISTSRGLLVWLRRSRSNAIHPGYGFLSENADFARACVAAGIVFIGPRPELLDLLGDKVAARALAREAGVPVLSGSDSPVEPGPGAHAAADALGFPVIVKASMGGGGRGMRVVETSDALDQALDQARREALNAFGCADVFLEKFIRRAKHIEVQLLGDSHGHLVHLHERDCSIQRRHQKVIEIAPAYNLDPSLREAICQSAIAIGQKVGYENAGTVEFLVDDESGAFYFIEVNPRLQVEHTITEIVTGIDIVKSQILIAQGASLPTRRSASAARSRSRRRDTRSSAGSRAKTPPTTLFPTTDGSRTIDPRAALASGWTAARPRRAPSSRRFMIRFWSRFPPMHAASRTRPCGWSEHSRSTAFEG